MGDTNASDIENQNISKYKNTETISFYFLSIVYIIFFYITYLFYDNLVTNTLAKNIALAYSLNDTGRMWKTVNSTLILKRFFLFLWIIVFIFIFVVGIVYMSIMKGTHVGSAMKTSAICIIGIVGGAFLLMNSNLFVKVFENTVGYGWIQTIAGKDVEHIMNLLFEHNTFKNPPILPDTKIDLGFLLSIFSIDNFVNVLNDIKDEAKENKYDFSLRNNDSMKTKFDSIYYEDRENVYLKSIQYELEHPKSDTNITDIVVNDLAKMTVRKNTIGHLCWIYFAGIVSTVVSMKYLYKII
jgi:hypothetical protein